MRPGEPGLDPSARIAGDATADFITWWQEHSGLTGVQARYAYFEILLIQVDQLRAEKARLLQVIRGGPDPFRVSTPARPRDDGCQCQRHQH